MYSCHFTTTQQETQPQSQTKVSHVITLTVFPTSVLSADVDCPCAQAGGGGEAEMRWRPAAERGRVHGYHLPGLHPDVCPQAERRRPGRGAGHRLCELLLMLFILKNCLSYLIFKDFLLK